MVSGDLETSWLKPDVARLLPPGPAWRAFRGELLSDDEEESLLAESLGDSSALMFILKDSKGSRNTQDLY